MFRECQNCQPLCVGIIHYSGWFLCVWQPIVLVRNTAALRWMTTATRHFSMRSVIITGIRCTSMISQSGVRIAGCWEYCLCITYAVDTAQERQISVVSCVTATRKINWLSDISASIDDRMYLNLVCLMSSGSFSLLINKVAHLFTGHCGARGALGRIALGLIVLYKLNLLMMYLSSAVAVVSTVLEYKQFIVCRC